ncbi:unnamed protein product [Effrenium voratum]|uniref:Uncharacterized protein n=1 Tax=Effrenium voratum TaxID=2562239 RepID=A0AA36HSX3_9DINO|nr:unnamed protein product [Effrenium voratum]
MPALADGAILACRLPEGGASLGLKQPSVCWLLWPCREVTLIWSHADSKFHSHPSLRLRYLQLQARSLSHVVVPCKVSCRFRWGHLGLQVARRSGFAGAAIKQPMKKP